MIAIFITGFGVGFLIALSICSTTPKILSPSIEDEFYSTELNWAPQTIHEKWFKEDGYIKTNEGHFAKEIGVYSHSDRYDYKVHYHTVWLSKKEIILGCTGFRGYKGLTRKKELSEKDMILIQDDFNRYAINLFSSRFDIDI